MPRQDLAVLGSPTPAHNTAEKDLQQHDHAQGEVGRLAVVFPEEDVAAAAAGIVLCYAWYRLIRSYRDLNGAKFKVIHRLERRLPAAPYDAEWEAVGRGEDSDLYLPFTHIEIAVPWVFLALHIVVLAKAIPWQLLAS